MSQLGKHSKNSPGSLSVLISDLYCVRSLPSHPFTLITLTSPVWKKEKRSSDAAFVWTELYSCPSLSVGKTKVYGCAN